MLEILGFVLEKIDFLGISEALRKKANRTTAARLHLVLLQAYEILDLYRALFDELRNALTNHEQIGANHHFALNPWRMMSLLKRQSSNLEVLETLLYDLRDEVVLLDPAFANGFREIFPGKFSILMEAETLLEDGRLSLSDGSPEVFPASKNGEYHSLLFTDPASNRDPNEAKLLWGENAAIIEVSVHNADAFFKELRRYLNSYDPWKKLAELEEVTERYKAALISNFTLEDLLTDIRKVRRHYSWGG